MIKLNRQLCQLEEKKQCRLVFLRTFKNLLQLKGHWELKSFQNMVDFF